MIKETKLILFLLTVAIIGISGCGNNELSQGSLSITSEVFLATNTTGPILSSTPTPTSTTVLSPTATTIPTMTFGEAEESLWELIRNNGECQFPCVWGITPGLTDKDSLITFANSYGEHRENESGIIFVYHVIDLELWRYENPGLGSVGLISFKDDVRTRVDFTYLLDGNLTHLVSLSFRQDLMIGEGIGTEYIELFGGATFNQIFSKYLIPQILAEYGISSEILIAFADEDLWYKSVYWMPFNLVLYYPEQGFLVEYVSSLDQEGDLIVGCPNKSHISIFAWSDEKGPPEEGYLGQDGKYWGLNTEGLYPYKPIEEVTNYSIDTFYEEFLNQENDLCIETSLSYWLEN